MRQDTDISESREQSMKTSKESVILRKNIHSITSPNATYNGCATAQHNVTRALSGGESDCQRPNLETADANKRRATCRGIRSGQLAPANQTTASTL